MKIETPTSQPARLAPDAAVTLVEMLVVIVIIGLITAIVALNVLPSQNTARVEKAKADIHVLEQALELYRLQKGRLPTTSEGLQALLGAGEPGAQGGGAQSHGFIRRLPKDPWGRDYVYISPGEKAEYDLVTLGADAQEGGEGVNADISNAQN